MSTGGGRISSEGYLFHYFYLPKRQNFTTEFDIKWRRGFKESCKVAENGQCNWKCKITSSISEVNFEHLS